MVSSYSLGSCGRAMIARARGQRDQTGSEGSECESGRSPGEDDICRDEGRRVVSITTGTSPWVWMAVVGSARMVIGLTVCRGHTGCARGALRARIEPARRPLRRRRWRRGWGVARRREGAQQRPGENPTRTRPFPIQRPDETILQSRSLTRVPDKPQTSAPSD